MKPVCHWSYNLYHGKEKTKEFLWNSSLKNPENLLNSSYCFNQNVPYATMLQGIKIIIEELIVGIQMEFQYFGSMMEIKETCKQESHKK